MTRSRLQADNPEVEGVTAPVPAQAVRMPADLSHSRAEAAHTVPQGRFATTRP